MYQSLSLCIPNYAAPLRNTPALFLTTIQLHGSCKSHTSICFLVADRYIHMQPGTAKPCMCDNSFKLQLYFLWSIINEAYVNNCQQSNFDKLMKPNTNLMTFVSVWSPASTIVTTYVFFPAFTVITTKVLLFLQWSATTIYECMMSTMTCTFRREQYRSPSDATTNYAGL